MSCLLWVQSHSQQGQWCPEIAGMPGDAEWVTNHPLPHHAALLPTPAALNLKHDQSKMWVEE